MRPDATLIAKLLAEAGIEGASLEETPSLGVVYRTTAETVGPAARALKDSDHEFVFLVDLLGIDTGEGIDVVYHLRSFARDEEVYLKALHPYGGELVSVWDAFPAALTAERELAEMFGLTLAGHPNPKFLLVTEGTEPQLLKTTRIRTAEEVRNR